MSATTSSLPSAVRDTKQGPPPGVSAGPSLPAGVTAEPQAPLGPGVQHKDSDALDAKPCDTCGTTDRRNLVVCIDGTSNQFSTKNTNVVELYSRLVKDKTQLTFYTSGIGTYAKPSWKSWDYRKQVIANTLDLAFALRFEKIIISAYAWLVDNYEEGDRIFLFGFSRGAYQVRALAAMIHVVGLLHKGNDDQIPFAYELYAASDEPQMDETPARTSKNIRPLPERISQWWRSKRDKNNSKPSFPWPASDREGYRQDFDSQSSDEHGITMQNRMTMQNQFKNTFSRQNVSVHFVGAWDTVSSVGFIRDKTLPFTTNGMEFVCFFRHALALHEFRVKFLPEYANGGEGPNPSEIFSRTGELHTKETWFTGSHSDIGGGSTANTKLNNFGPALRWMSWEASLAGLRIADSPDSWESIGVSKSMTAMWSIVECLPIKRLTYRTDGSSFTWRPHFFACRHILPYQRIHQSVYEECDDFEALKDVFEEADAYLVLRTQAEVERSGRILGRRGRESLRQLTSSENGLRSLRSLHITRYIYDVARRCLYPRWRFNSQIFDDLQEIYAAFVSGSFAVDRKQEGADATKTTSPKIFPFHMCGHADTVSSVAFLSDTLVVSGSCDKTLRIWDVYTGMTDIDGPLSGHSDAINCVAVHAASGRIASASDNSTIRLWTSDSDGAVGAGKVLQDGSSGDVLAVAFSPDGSHLVSGSSDGAIRIWNTAGRPVGRPAHGHEDWVRSVAFSSDGRRIVSGSNDRTVRLWEWSGYEATPEPYGEPLSAHMSRVFSVAFSPDGRFIASGSEDMTVRIWDLTARTSKPMEGHIGAVSSVAFTPDGKYVVSGSDDWTVRIWNAHTGHEVRVLRGHTHWVRSVALSPDGTMIASGSWDNTVRVWDFARSPDESNDGEIQTAPAQIVPA